MKKLGLFGFTISEKYGGTGLDYLTYAMVCEEIARGWMSITGIINTHFIVSYLLEKFGTDEQKQRFLPADGHRGNARRVFHERAQLWKRRAGHRDQGDS